MRILLFVLALLLVWGCRAMPERPQAQYEVVTTPLMQSDSTRVGTRLALVRTSGRDTVLATIRIAQQTPTGIDSFMQDLRLLTTTYFEKP